MLVGSVIIIRGRTIGQSSELVRPSRPTSVVIVICMYRFQKTLLDIPMLSREFESIETVIPDGSKKQMFI